MIRDPQGKSPPQPPTANESVAPVDDKAGPSDLGTKKPAAVLAKARPTRGPRERMSITPSSFTPAAFTLMGNGPADALKEPTGTRGALTPGSQFGVYLVGARIGEGGMARIYQAEHAGLRRKVALKVLTDGFARDPDGRERFLREARIVAAIKHPNVVNIFDVGVHDDIPYIVMELLEGQDLEQLLEAKRPLDEGLIIDIMIPVMAGLIAVHDAGIVHRDLKPGNIFLSQGRYNDLEPKLLDFGISKAAGPDQFKLTAHRTFMGTPFYISPEGLQGGEMTPLSDQYSLGVVMYECATGLPPFTASTFAELSALITSGQFAPPSAHNSELSRRLVRIIERAMSLKPEQRFRDLREMGQELLFLAGQRTRITWGLSFGDVKPIRTSNPATQGASAPPPATQRKGKPFAFASYRMVPLLLLGAGLLAVLFGGVLSRRTARPPLAAGIAASSPPQANREPVAATGSVASERVASPPQAAADATRDHVDKDREPVAGGAPDGKSAGAVRDERSAPGRSKARLGATARRTTVAAPDPLPEWALPTVVPTPSQTKAGSLPPALGANGAPIFD
jgi:eukaryotic-like serine/threonine-protein kinase